MLTSKRITIFLVFLFTFFGFASINMGVPAYPTLENYFHVDESQMKLAMTVFLLGYAIAQFFWGTISDRYGRRKIILIATAIAIVGSVFVATAHSIHVFILARFIEAIGVGYTSVMGRIVLADCCHHDELQIYIAYVLIIVALMPAISSIIGGHLLAWFDWQATYYCLSILGISTLILTELYFKETCAHPSSKLSFMDMFKTYSALLANKTFTQYLLSVSLIFGGLIAFYTVIAPYVFIKDLGYKSLRRFYDCNGLAKTF